MWYSIRAFALLLSCVPIAFTLNTSYSPRIWEIIRAAGADGIDLISLPFASAAFASIETIQKQVPANVTSVINGSRIDTHVHVVPDWYRAMVPLTGGNPTPEWDIESHLTFMIENDIGHDILSISSPGSGIFPGNEAFSIGLARLLNEWLAALPRTYTSIFSFYSVTPLPYTQAAIREVSYTLTHLNAIGTGLLSNHEGYYLGNPAFTPFFSFLSSRCSQKDDVIFIHPSYPVLHLNNGSLIPANPTVYPSGSVEFYFETARTVMDLTISLTLQNFTGIRYLLPHEGGAFPSIEDRMLRSLPALMGPTRQIFNTRYLEYLYHSFWYDSAGPIFYNQVKGLLGYGVPTSQLVFGSDYPYAPNTTYTGSINAIVDAGFLNAKEKQDLFRRNAETLFDGRICCQH